ncbi:hypothetical protein LJC49_01925 [Ruminococcaceae bacterium OttesenSCG-928-I18]|nr:hypothetical protein [Ruminococcaceae bacterium OttesenSCG-928-I18]
MAGGSGKSNQSKRVALGGILSALALLFLLGAGFLPIATFSGPIFASLCLIPLVAELGVKTSLLAYAGVCLLSLFLVPDKEVVLFFLFLTGYYPSLRPQIQRIPYKPLRVICKLGLFNVAVFVTYAILLFVLTSPVLQAELAERAPWFFAGLLLIGNLTFLLYDVLVEKIQIIYLYRIRKNIFR